MVKALIGREREDAELANWFGSAPTGHPRLAMLEGDAGIGKTALAQVLADAARARGSVVLWASGVEEAGVPPYWLWRQVTDVDPTGDRFVFFDRLRAALLADEGVLVVVDDVQWVDEPSLLALRHVLRQQATTPLWVCATRRIGDQGAGWERVGPDLLAGPDVHRLHLHGLGQDAAAALLEGSAGRALPADVVQRAASDSGGNPLFLRELGRLLGAGGLVAGRDLSQLIDVRVRRLSPPAQRLLHAASILAEEWELPVVARLVEQPTAACLAAVDETLTVGLLTVAGGGRFRFSHGLVRSVLAGQIPLLESVTLHMRAAEALEDLNRGALSTSLADIARHWAAVAVTGDRQRAVEWATRAADEAMRAVAYEEAVRLYCLALDSGGGSLPPSERARLRLARAAAALAAGALESAYDDCRQAVALARKTGTREIVADAALCLEAIGDRRWDRSVREWCREALLDTVASQSIRARLLARLAEACVYSGQVSEGIEHAGEALQVAELDGDEDAIVAALRARQLTLSDPDHRDERVQLATRMTALGEQLHRPEVEMWGRLWAIDAMWERGNLVGIAAEISNLRWCVQEVGTPTARWHLLVSRAALAQARADFDEALAAAREGCELMLSIGHPAAVGAFMSLAVTVGHHRGQDEVTTRVAPSGAPADTGEVRNELFAYIGPATALADAGRLEEAAHTYRLPGPPSTWDIPPYFRIQALHAGASIAVAIGLHDDIAWFRTRLERSRRRHVAGGAGSAAYCGPTELILGRCAATLGDLRRAAVDLADAMQICSEVGAPGFEVEAGVELADVLTRQGKGQTARSQLHRLRPAALRLGMTPWVERIDAALAAGDDPLTAREREVAALIARGRSNRDIAVELVLSERTAANHVQHILAKLGFGNRSQIAAWVATNE